MTDHSFDIPKKLKTCTIYYFSRNYIKAILFEKQYSLKCINHLSNTIKSTLTTKSSWCFAWRILIYNFSSYFYEHFYIRLVFFFSLFFRIFFFNCSQICLESPWLNFISASSITRANDLSFLNTFLFLYREMKNHQR